MKMDPDEYTGQVGKYGKEFNINMTRISSKNRDIHESMLAYSEHARKTSQSRLLSTSLPDASVLRVRAHHIPEMKHASRKWKPLAPLDGEDNDTSKSDDAFQRKLEKLQEESKTLEGNDKQFQTDHGSYSRVAVVGAAPEGERTKRVHLPPKSVISVANLDALFDKRHRRRTVWTSTDSCSLSNDRTPSPTNILVRESLKAAAAEEREEEESGPVDDSPVARAERSRKRREAKTRLLLRDAISSLEALEENMKNPMLTLPRLKKPKRLTLSKGTLDVIPEIRREDEVENDDDDNRNDVSVHMSTWKSEPGYKSRDYHHVYPYSNNASVLDDGKYSIKSDPFQWRTTKLQQQKTTRRGTKDPDNKVSSVRRTSVKNDSLDHQRYDPDIHIKERKRRLQEHAKVRLRKPMRFKFLKNDSEPR